MCLKANALAEEIRKEFVVPFCTRYNLMFMSGNGTYYFVFLTLGRDAGKIWYVGEERRPEHERPEGPAGEEDKWWHEPTEGERRLKSLLDMSVYDNRACLGSWIRDYPEKKGT